MSPALVHSTHRFAARGLTDADSALLLLLLGILLIYAEFNRPGTILLGATGALLFMLGVYKLLPLEVSAMFVSVAALGLALLLFELRFALQGRHAFGAGVGTLAMIFGLHHLVHQPNGVHWRVAIFTGTVFSAVTYTLGRIALLAARNKRVTVGATPLNLKAYPANPNKSGCTE